MNKKISVIVPIYNVENYLIKCIDSIIFQTYKDIEIILVDDGSTDRSAEICDNYAQNDDRIRVVHQKNQGLVAARKVGLKLSKGDYIIFVDGDDDISPILCERMLYHIQYYNADFVHSNYLINNEKIHKGILDKQIVDYKHLTFSERLGIVSKEVFGYKNNNQNKITPSIWSKIFRKDIIVECYNILDNNYSYGEDLICLCHVLMRCHKAVFVPEAYYNYYERKGSLSHTYDLYNFARISNLYAYINQVFTQYDCINEIKDAINYFYMHSIKMMLLRLETQNGHINWYYYKKIEQLRNKKIIIYGAGRVGRDFYEQMSRYKDIEIVAWVDKNSDNISYDYNKVMPPEIINDFNYDYIVIAILKEEVAKVIRKKLLFDGVDENKIIYNKPEECFTDIFDI